MRQGTRIAARAASIALAVLVLTGGGASAQYFGKNKVQYRAFQWEVLESEHFDVYFYPRERAAAVEAARMAERAYAALSRALAHEVQDKIPLIVYASHTDFQSTNVTPGMIQEGTGGVTELAKRRVFLPFTGSYGELDHVLTHELVHAFQLDILYSRAENLLTNPVAFAPPLWMIEGMAEYLSIGEIDNHTEMWLRDAALQGYLVSLSELSEVGDIRVYRFGQGIMAYIAERFGEEKIGELFKRAVYFRSLDRALEDVIGIDLDRLSRDWTEHVRRTYLPSIADHQKPTDFARQLTHHGDDLSQLNLAVSASPDGDRFVFISDRSLYNDLYVASAIDGKNMRRLIKGERTGDFESLRFFATSIAWSPDGRHLALPAKEGGEDALVVFDVQKRKVEARHRFGLDGILSPTWSPDGRQIAFVGFYGGQSDLYVMTRDGKTLRRLTESRYMARDPQWSPDGKWIAFTTDMGSATDFDRLEFSEPLIALYDVETGRVHVIPNQKGKCIDPQWAPDSRRILFVSDRTGISNVYVMDLAGENVGRLTNILTGVSGLTADSPAISLSRNGKRLLLTAFDSGGFDIYAMDNPLGEPEAEDDRPVPESYIVDARGLPVEDGAVVRPPGPAGAAAAPPAAADRSESAAATTAEGGTIGAPAPARAGDAAPDSVTSREAKPAREATDVADPSRPADGALVALATPPVDSAGDGASRGDAEGMSTTPSGRAADGDTVRAPAAANSTAAEGPEEALPSPSSFNFRRYRLRFSPDFVAANGLFASNVGLAAQTAVGFSDVLGNHQFVIGASVYGSLVDADLLLSYSNLAHRVNYGVSLFQYRSDFVVRREENGDDEFVSQVHRGLELAISRPWDRFRRLELGFELVGIEERTFGSSFYSPIGPTTFIDIPGDSGSRFFARPRAAVVSDNVLYGSTGPISGTRSRLQVERAVGGVDFTTALADYRHYFNMRQRYVLAWRAISATSFGAHPQSFRIGGSYTLRGYDFGEIDGTSVVLSNLEFRYPLIDFVKFGWPLPIAFSGIRGLLFFDIGGAWDESVHFKPIGGREGRSGFYLNDLAASYGFGARMNVFGFLVARWDLSRRTDLKSNIGPWLGRFSLGAEF